jgi:tRNA pseudouridine55 synthase
MKSVINLYKPVSMTPLEAVEKFRIQHKEYSKIKMSYPGRLDPMACGVLLLLVGDENKKMKQYMGLDKEYRAKILLGFSSDSHDILGLGVKGDFCELEIKEIKKVLKGFKGSYLQKLPVYSSYKIKGKSLFYYARSGRLDEVKIPSKNVKINDVKVEGIYQIGSGKLFKEINKKVSDVNGDFRQDEIVERWKELLVNEDEKFLVVDVVISCGSGTYIRAIARDFGLKIGCGGLLLGLERLRVGKFVVRESERLK